VIFPALAVAVWRLIELEGADDSEINETLAWGWFVLLYILLLAYTGFATVQRGVEPHVGGSAGALTEQGPGGIAEVRPATRAAAVNPDEKHLLHACQHSV
jgi:hypothetical protein